MKKYIIKNCPAYWNQVYSCTRYTETSCQTVQDCLLKHIVEKCNAEIEGDYVMNRNGVKVPQKDGYNLAVDILKLLEIEECE